MGTAAVNVILASAFPADAPRRTEAAAAHTKAITFVAYVRPADVMTFLIDKGISLSDAVGIRLLRCAASPSY